MLAVNQFTLWIRNEFVMGMKISNLYTIKRVYYILIEFLIITKIGNRVGKLILILQTFHPLKINFRASIVFSSWNRKRISDKFQQFDRSASRGKQP